MVSLNQNEGLNQNLEVNISINCRIFKAVISNKNLRSQLDWYIFKRNTYLR